MFNIWCMTDSHLFYKCKELEDKDKLIKEMFTWFSTCPGATYGMVAVRKKDDDKVMEDLYWHMRPEHKKEDFKKWVDYFFKFRENCHSYEI